MAMKHLDRLHDVQEKIINKTEDQLKQLLKFKQDYNALRERLVSLADRITYDVMVPFGTVAFMPGKLVHTNEIRVYLGDGWFVDRSTKQAIEIIDRRIKNIDDDLSEFQKQRDLLKPHLDFTKEFKDEEREAFEITEECSEEELAAWKAEHRRKVRRYRQDQLEARKVAMTQDEEETYWQRMDEAERIGAQSSSLWSVKEEEEVGPEMSQAHGGLSSRVGPCLDDFYVDVDSNRRTIRQPASPPGNSSRKTAGKTVRWKDVVQEESEKDEEVEDSSDDSEEYVELCRPNVINFAHTPSSNAPQPIQRPSPTKDGIQQILSPADIGPSFLLNTPKSILKKRSSIEEGKMENALEISDPSKEMSPSQLKVLSSRPLVKEADLPATSASSSSASQIAVDATVANLGIIKVVEKNIESCDSPVSQETSAICTCERSKTVSNDQTDKRVSKFKATRLKKTSAVVK